MDKKRVEREIHTLKKVSPSVTPDLDEQFVALEMWPFPPGWEPRTGAIVYVLPDTYPQEQPTAYLPDEMRYNGSRPSIMLRAGPDGWSKYCIHDLSDSWVPERHSLITMTRMINESLKYPDDEDPWTAARRHSP